MFAVAEAEEKQGKYVAKRGAGETVKLFGNDARTMLTTMLRISNGMLNFGIVGFLEFEMEYSFCSVSKRDVDIIVIIKIELLLLRVIFKRDGI